MGAANYENYVHAGNDINDKLHDKLQKIVTIIMHTFHTKAMLW